MAIKKHSKVYQTPWLVTGRESFRKPGVTSELTVIVLFKKYTQMYMYYFRMIFTLMLLPYIHCTYKCRVKYICMANFDRDQKSALMIPAKKAYGDVYKWNEKVLGDLCSLLEALPVRDILKLASDVVSIVFVPISL